MSKAEPGHTYRHYKGSLYRVLMIAVHTETMEPLVIYTDDAHVWARPQKMFEEQIELDGVRIDRFTRMD